MIFIGEEWLNLVKIPLKLILYCLPFTLFAYMNCHTDQPRPVLPLILMQKCCLSKRQRQARMIPYLHVLSKVFIAAKKIWYFCYLGVSVTPRFSYSIILVYHSHYSVTWTADGSVIIFNLYTF